MVEFVIGFAFAVLKVDVELRLKSFFANPYDQITVQDAPVEQLMNDGLIDQFKSRGLPLGLAVQQHSLQRQSLFLSSTKVASAAFVDNDVLASDFNRNISRTSFCQENDLNHERQGFLPTQQPDSTHVFSGPNSDRCTSNCNSRPWIR